MKISNIREIFILSVFVRNVFINQAINKTNTGVAHLCQVQTLTLAFTYKRIYLCKNLYNEKLLNIIEVCINF